MPHHWRDEDWLDMFYDDEPLHYRMVTSIIGDQSPLGLPPQLYS
jgi:hypothetical protein